MEDLARQAGLDPSFLEYFERHTDVQLGRGALSTIAARPADFAGEASRR